MVDVEEINAEIAKLEHSDTTYRTLEKLSVLYAVRNNLSDSGGYSFASAPEEKPPDLTGASEFLQACYNTDITHVLSVINDHMQAVALLYPKEYNLVINRLRNPTT